NMLELINQVFNLEGYQVQRERSAAKESALRTVSEMAACCAWRGCFRLLVLA
ncbi:unnamed protein product, partial [marine sediment metagenome]